MFHLTLHTLYNNLPVFVYDVVLYIITQSDVLSLLSDENFTPLCARGNAVKTPRFRKHIIIVVESFVEYVKRRIKDRLQSSFRRFTRI